MGRHDWYRRTTWTPQDQAEFEARFARSRGAFSKAQYLLIQSGYLARAGLLDSALVLIERMLSDYPLDSELESAYLARALIHEELGEVALAIGDCRSAMAAHENYPNLFTGVELELAWIIVHHRVRHLYSDVDGLLQKYAKGPVEDLPFPYQRFRIATIRALLADQLGQKSIACEFARKALSAASESKSAFRKHPELGLVKDVSKTLMEQLAALAHVQVIKALSPSERDRFEL